MAADAAEGRHLFLIWAARDSGIDCVPASTTRLIANRNLVPVVKDKLRRRGIVAISHYA
jgi:hypothetical protein